MSTQETWENPASPINEATGIDESTEGRRKKLANAIRDGRKAVRALKTLVNPKMDVLDTAKFKVSDALSRARYWSKDLGLPEPKIKH
ncbi:MAG: hypothetical protein RLZZ283_139 [Candidatus Parcubacteria bacterium]|jgi:hypothetical protein